MPNTCPWMFADGAKVNCNDMRYRWFRCQSAWISSERTSPWFMVSAILKHVWSANEMGTVDLPVSERVHSFSIKFIPVCMKRENRTKTDPSANFKMWLVKKRLTCQMKILLIPSNSNSASLDRYHWDHVSIFRNLQDFWSLPSCAKNLAPSNCHVLKSSPSNLLRRWHSVAQNLCRLWYYQRSWSTRESGRKNDENGWMHMGRWVGFQLFNWLSSLKIARRKSLDLMRRGFNVFSVFIQQDAARVLPPFESPNQQQLSTFCLKVLQSL